jgi:hypothetical protein
METGGMQRLLHDFTNTELSGSFRQPFAFGKGKDGRPINPP